jgi:hypothetical protein
MWSALPAWAEPVGGIEAYQAARLDVIDAPVTTVYARDYDGSGRFWFVVDGAGDTLSALELAERAGDTNRLADLRRRQATRVWGGTALLVVGLAATFAPLAPLDLPESTRWIGLSTGAVSLTAGGLVLGSVVRLRHPAAAWTRDEATATVRGYNAGLRDELLGP